MGRKLTDAHKKKLSLSHLGLPSPRKGCVLSELTKKKISLSKKGQPSNRKGCRLSLTTKRKIAISLQKYFSDPLIRKAVSERTKQAMLSEIVREKIKSARRLQVSPMKGRHLSIDAKNKIRVALKGRRLSDETKRKISDKIKAVRHTWESSSNFKNTSIELKMQAALRRRGLIFETQKKIFGQPDIFIAPNICVFADGDYWHGYPVGKRRDIEVSSRLEEEGYIIFRFWEHQINQDADDCARVVLTHISHE